MNGLKPCPFCGSEDVDFEKVIARRPPYSIGVIVKCSECGCQTGVAWHLGKGHNEKEEASKSWNRRKR